MIGFLCLLLAVAVVAFWWTASLCWELNTKLQDANMSLGYWMDCHRANLAKIAELTTDNHEINEENKRLRAASDWWFKARNSVDVGDLGPIQGPPSAYVSW